jgi:hypothetical protein
MRAKQVIALGCLSVVTGVAGALLLTPKTASGRNAEQPLCPDTICFTSANCYWFGNSRCLTDGHWCVGAEICQ